MEETTDGGVGGGVVNDGDYTDISQFLSVNLEEIPDDINAETQQANAEIARAAKLAKVVQESIEFVGGGAKCPLCQKIVSKGKIRIHLRTHTGERPFSCTICSKRFSRSDKLTAHKRTHTVNKPYMCVCGMVFSKKQQLRGHAATHHILEKNAHSGTFMGADPACMGDSKTYTDKHMANPARTEANLAHTDPDPPLIPDLTPSDPLEINPEASETRGRAKRATKTPRKIFTCPYCGRGFVQSFKYKRHVLVHTGETPYVCECGARYGRSEKLRRHLLDNPGHRRGRKIDGKIGGDGGKTGGNGATFGANGATFGEIEGNGATFGEIGARFGGVGGKIEENGGTFGEIGARFGGVGGKIEENGATFGEIGARLGEVEWMGGGGEKDWRERDSGGGDWRDWGAFGEKDWREVRDREERLIGDLRFNIESHLSSMEELERIYRGGERLGGEILTTERLIGERLTGGRLGTERLGGEILTTERLMAERLNEERLGAERLGAERIYRGGEILTAERLGGEILTTERLGGEILTTERLRGEISMGERLEIKRIVGERLKEKIERLGGKIEKRRRGRPRKHPLIKGNSIDPPVNLTELNGDNVDPLLLKGDCIDPLENVICDTGLIDFKGNGIDPLAHLTESSDDADDDSRLARFKGNSIDPLNSNHRRKYGKSGGIGLRGTRNSGGIRNLGGIEKSGGIRNSGGNSSGGIGKSRGTRNSRGTSLGGIRNSRDTGSGGIRNSRGTSLGGIRNSRGTSLGGIRNSRGTGSGGTRNSKRKIGTSRDLMQYLKTISDNPELDLESNLTDQEPGLSDEEPVLTDQSELSDIKPRLNDLELRLTDQSGLNNFNSGLTDLGSDLPSHSSSTWYRTISNPSEALNLNEASKQDSIAENELSEGSDEPLVEEGSGAKTEEMERSGGKMERSSPEVERTPGIDGVVLLGSESDVDWEGLIDNATLECPICYKVLSRRRKLIAHIRTHTGKRPYQCNQCHKTFTRSDKLAAHTRIHTGERPFVCICLKTFTRIDHLKSHVNLHKLDPQRAYEIVETERRKVTKNPRTPVPKDLNCVYCGVHFHDRYKYNRHLRLHTGERPYICICGAKYARTERLRTHLLDNPSHKALKKEDC